MCWEWCPIGGVSLASMHHRVAVALLRVPLPWRRGSRVWRRQMRSNEEERRGQCWAEREPETSPESQTAAQRHGCATADCWSHAHTHAYTQIEFVEFSHFLESRWTCSYNTQIFYNDWINEIFHDGLDLLTSLTQGTLSNYMGTLSNTVCCTWPVCLSSRLGQELNSPLQALNQCHSANMAL